MNNRSVAHAFAHRQSGKGSNMFTDGTTIYSYGHHFPIATFIDDDTVLFTSRSYSVSTAKHMSYTWSALCGNNYNIFVVPSISCNSISHNDNLSYLAEQSSEARAKSFRARLHGDHYKNIAIEQYRNLRTYINHFKISKDKIPEDVNLFINEFPNSDTLFTTKDLDVFAEKAKAENERRNEINKQKEKAEREKLAENIQKFRNHEISSVDSWRAGNFTYLRLAHDKQTVQTSKGISIPTIIFNRLYRLSKKESIVGKTITDINGTTYTIDKYNGEFKAGCHNIKKEEIESIALILGV